MGLEERSDDALIRAPAVPGILPPGKIVEGEKAAGVYEGAVPPVLMGWGSLVRPIGINKEWSSARWLHSILAVRTRLELATPGVTGRYSKPTELPHQSFQ